MLFFNRADGDAEPFGDLLMRKQLHLAEQQNRAATRRQIRDGRFEHFKFLLRHDLLGHAGSGRSGNLGIERAGSDRRNRPPFEAVDRQPAGGGVKQGFGVLSRGLAGSGINPQIRIMGHILRLGGIAEQTGQVTA